jgi:hypothetical protein
MAEPIWADQSWEVEVVLVLTMRAYSPHHHRHHHYRCPHQRSHRILSSFSYVSCYPQLS